MPGTDQIQTVRFHIRCSLKVRFILKSETITIGKCYDPEEGGNGFYGVNDEDNYSDDEHNYGNYRRSGQTESSDVVSTLTNEHLIFCKSSVRGYSLKNKKWRM